MHSRATPALVAGVGYQKLTYEHFITLLRAKRIDLVVDIREHAFSFRPPFSRLLGGSLRADGIDYAHVQILGTPKWIRAMHRHGKNDDEFRALYREHLLAHTEGLVSLAEDFAGRRMALLCYEADPAQCHRSIVLAELAKRLPKSTPIFDLRKESDTHLKPVRS